MLLTLLIACVLLGSVSCSPSPTASGVAVSEESSPLLSGASPDIADAIVSTAGPQASVTLDQVIAKLSGFYQATARAAAAEPLTEMAKTLASIQTSVATVSERLDLMYNSQLQLQKVQTSLAKRLDVIERSQTEASSRFDNIESTLSRPDGMQQLLNETDSRLDTVQKAQSDLSRAHSARFDAVEASQGDLSSRIDTVLQQQTAASNKSAAVRGQLDAIQAAVSRIPKIVLGKACSRNTDCSRTVPGAVCGSAGLCSCQNGYRQVSDTVCRKQSRLSQRCLENADCQALVPHAACTSGSCSCAGGFWNYNNAECRHVSAVNYKGSCVGDQDCISNSQCTSGACSCPYKTLGGRQYRLAGGPSCSDGRVELRLPGHSWGLVCDDGWNSDDWGTKNANVFCRSLGFRSGVPRDESWYGRGTNYYMDDVKCSGSESHMWSCPSRSWGAHNCQAHEVAGVRCQN